MTASSFFFFKLKKPISKGKITMKERHSGGGERSGGGGEREEMR